MFRCCARILFHIFSLIFVHHCRTVVSASSSSSSLSLVEWAKWNCFKFLMSIPSRSRALISFNSLCSHFVIAVATGFVVFRQIEMFVVRSHEMKMNSINVYASWHAIVLSLSRLLSLPIPLGVCCHWQQNRFCGNCVFYLRNNHRFSVRLVYVLLGCLVGYLLGLSTDIWWHRYHCFTHSLTHSLAFVNFLERVFQFQSYYLPSLDLWSGRIEATAHNFHLKCTLQIE